MKTLLAINLLAFAAVSQASWLSLPTPLSDHSITASSDSRFYRVDPTYSLDNGQDRSSSNIFVTSLPSAGYSALGAGIYGLNITPDDTVVGKGLHSWMFYLNRPEGTTRSRARFVVSVDTTVFSRIGLSTTTPITDFVSATGADYLGIASGLSFSGTINSPGISLTDSESRNREIVFDTFFRDNSTNGYSFGRLVSDPTFERASGYYAAVSYTTMPFHEDWSDFDASTTSGRIEGAEARSSFTSDVDVTDVLVRQNLHDSTDPNDAIVTVSNVGNGIPDHRAPLAFFVDQTTREVEYVVAGKKDGSSVKFYTNWPEETYDVFLYDKAMLVQSLGSVTLGDGNKSLTGVAAQYGDAVPDNSIDLLDYLFLSDAYNQDFTWAFWGTEDATGVVAADADFNGDGSVDLLDYLILSDSYNDVGDTAAFKI